MTHSLADTPVVRRAVPGDESLIREVRLQALADAPGEFGSTLERELARTPDDWRRWTSEGATFLLERAGVPLGIASGVPHWTDPSAVFLLAVWVHPALRGTGAADRLVAAVLAWARAAGVAEVWLHVVRDNARARRVYERNGFRATGRESVRERDGVIEVEMRRALESAAAP